MKAIWAQTKRRNGYPEVVCAVLVRVWLDAAAAGKVRGSVIPKGGVA